MISFATSWWHDFCRLTNSQFMKFFSFKTCTCGNLLYLGVVRDRFICIGDRDIAILSPHNYAPGELLLRESAGILPIYALGYIYCVLCIAYFVLCPFKSALNIVFLSKSTFWPCVFQWKRETLGSVQLLHIPQVLTSTDKSETFARLVWAHI